MRIKTYQKIIYVSVMSLLLVGVLVACSNSNDEDPNNENQQIEENMDRINEDEVNDENNEESNDHGSSDSQEQRDRVEHESDEAASDGQNVENDSIDANDLAEDTNIADDSSDANDTPDDSDITVDDNTNANSNPTTPLPPEPSDQQTEKPARNPDANASEDRPTLRTPVESDDDPRTLTIGMFQMDSSARIQTSFRRIYTSALEWQYPNLEIEFASVVQARPAQFEEFSIDITSELRRMITGDNPPDVLFLSYSDYLSLMKEDLFVALNPFFVDSELSLDDFEPIVADGLVNPQDGQTYGLSPFFHASALIYNKDLFDEMNVPYPQDHMTWEEVFTLAKQMTIRSEERDVYGFAFDIHNHRVPSIFDVWDAYAHSLEVEFFDRETEKPLVNNDEWANILISVKDLYDAGVFPTESEEGQIQRGNPFYANTVAMAIVPYGELRGIIDDTLSGQQSVPNWDVVTVPVDPKRPHIGAGVAMEPVIVINANGKNQLDAWRLIESIHGEEWASMNEERLIYNLSSRKDYAVNLAEVEYNKAAFYQLRPSKYHPRQFHYVGIIDLYSILLIGAGLPEILAGETDVHEALEDFEDFVNYHLERYLK